jgi:hypothetical protein
MADTTPIAGGRPPSNPTSYNPVAGASFPPGTPVRQDLVHDDTVLPAVANSIETTIVTGLAAGAGVGPWGQRTNRVLVQYIGPLTLTVDQWDEITGDEGGLVRGVPYFLSATVPGKLTRTAPYSSGGDNFDAPVGVGLSPTTLLILLSFPSFNGSVSELKAKSGASSPAPTSSSDKATAP